MNLRSLRRCLERITDDAGPHPLRGFREFEDGSTECAQATAGDFEVDDRLERETILTREELATYHFAPELLAPAGMP